MPLLENSLNPRLNYYPATLTKGKEWYISFYAFNSATNKLKRKRIKTNRISSKTERLKYARNLIKELNEKLSNGWSPFIEEKASRSFIPIKEAIKIYENHTFKNLEKSSIRCYKSFLKPLIKWIDKNNSKMYCYSFDSYVSSKFLLYLKNSKELKPRTFNNYLEFYKKLFKWLAEYEYITVNPFSKFRKEKVNKKSKNRVAFTRTELAKLFSFLEQSNIRYCIICQLIYYCLLRPDDIVKLKRNQIDVKNHVIYINEDETKNDKNSTRVIPYHLDKYLNFLELEKVKSNEFIFSENRTFKAGTKQLDTRELARYWNNHVRKNMGYDLTKKLYSLKDTGITNMLSDGISPAFVQFQADHSSLEITNKYIHNNIPEGFEQLRNKMKSIF